MSGRVGPILYNYENLVFYTNPNSSYLTEIKNGLSGTLTGTTYLGSSILFNGTTNHITFPFYTKIQTNVVTVDCWFKPANTGSNSVLFSIYDWSNSNLGVPARGYALTWDINRFKFTYGQGNSGSNQIQTSSAVSILNKWSNIIVTNNLGITTFYLNGSLLSTHGSNTNLPLDWTYGTSIVPNVSISKQNNAAGGFFSGNMGPIKVYNKVLSPTEINTNYNQLANVYL